MDDRRTRCVEARLCQRNARVSYDGKTVEYGSADDLLKRIRTIETEITASSGASRPIAGYAGFGRGDR